MVTVETFYPYFKDSAGVSIDSRNISSNQIFFAIKGDRFDGHDFVQNVISKGVPKVVIDNPAFEVEGKTFLVEDTLKFLQDLSRHHRRQFNVPLMALTGSNGKTTTKELLTAVLSNKYKVYSTRGNYNNHIGVPLTLLEIKEDAEFILIEMGANHVGEIDFLSRIAEPDFGLITNIGYAHIEGFGSREGILKGKTELYRWVGSVGGTLFFNPKSKFLPNALPEGTKEVIPYSSDIELVKDDKYFLTIKDAEGALYHSKLYGDYNFINMQAAYTVGLYFDVDPVDACKSLADYNPEMNRSQVIEKSECTLIMDAYNANPSSMELAILSLADAENIQNKVLVLGDMFELGDEEIQFHADILNVIQQYEWSAVILVGSRFERADAQNIFLHFENVDEMRSQWDSITHYFKEATILFKGSRSIGLEKLQDLF